MNTRYLYRVELTATDWTFNIDIQNITLISAMTVTGIPADRSHHRSEPALLA